MAPGEGLLRGVFVDVAQEGTAHVGHGLLAIRSELGSLSFSCLGGGVGSRAPRGEPVRSLFLLLLLLMEPCLTDTVK